MKASFILIHYICNYESFISQAGQVKQGTDKVDLAGQNRQ